MFALHRPVVRTTLIAVHWRLFLRKGPVNQTRVVGTILEFAVVAGQTLNYMKM